MNGAASRRFWSDVERTDPGSCWAWIGSRWPTTGYGRFFVNGRYIGAHRVAWALHNDVNPECMATEMIIRHRCDNPTCVNPNHLEPGTTLDNTRDCVERGRHATAFQDGRCRRGHDVADPANVYVSGSDRHCAICNRMAAQRLRDQKRGVR